MMRAVRPFIALSGAATVAAAIVLVQLPTAQAGPAHPAAAADRGAALGSAARAAVNVPAAPGSTDLTNLGASGWEVLSSAIATQTGAQISTPGFSTSTWLPVSNDDAGAPGTEIEALAQNGKCPGDTALQPVNQSTSSANSVFFSSNMQTCYGSMSKIGADTVEPVQGAVVVAHRLHREPAAGQNAR